MEYDQELNFLKEELKKQGLEISDVQAEQFIRFYHDLVEKNKVMNLTAITDFEDAVRKHFADSISLIRDVDMTQHSKMIDIGSGAGFPGIPLKIAYPHINITFVDSVGKKVDFINEEVEKLGLKKAKAIHGRVEDLAHNKEYREIYDLCTSRAVARLSTLAEYCLPFVKKGGCFAAYKSGASDDEIKEAAKAIKVMGGKLVSVDKFEVYDYGRSMVIISKSDSTPKKYPRKAGTPSKSPIV